VDATQGERECQFLSLPSYRCLSRCVQVDAAAREEAAERRQASVHAAVARALGRDAARLTGVPDSSPPGQVPARGGRKRQRRLN